MSPVRRYIRSFTVRASAHLAYALWRDHATLAADFAPGVHAVMHGARTRWRVECEIEPCSWETVCTADVPGRLLTWTTVTSERARHSWDFWFAERADGWGTDIELVVVLEGNGAHGSDVAPEVGNSPTDLHFQHKVECPGGDPLLDPDPEHALDRLILLWQARLAQSP